MPRQNASLFEQPHGAIYGCNADPRIDRGSPSVNPLNIGMIGRLRQHAGNHPSLLGHFQTLIEAELLQPRDHRVSVMAWLMPGYYTRKHWTNLCPERNVPRPSAAPSRSPNAPDRVRRQSGSGTPCPGSETNFLGKPAALTRIVGRHHRVIGR